MSAAKKSILRDPQNIIAIGVTVISLCALIVSVQQTTIMKEERELMREYSRASVWPSLQWTTYKSEDSEDGSIKELKISLTNGGIGPAIITDVKISYKGKVANHWWDLFSIQDTPESMNTSISNRSFNDRIIKIGETIDIIDFDDNTALANEFYGKLGEVDVEIYYESIYKERWRYDGQHTTTIEDYKPLPDSLQFH